jgi:hypothetical protein
MAMVIDRTHVERLLTQGLSLREIARRLAIPWTTFQRHWQQVQREASAPIQAQVTEMPPRGRPPAVDPSPPVRRRAGVPEVHPGLPPALQAMQADLFDMVQWWRERQLRRVDPGGPRDTERWTVHVERQWIARVKEEAEAEGVPIMTVVNRALRRYFEGQ